MSKNTTRRGADEQDKRRKKIAAFALAGVVATAGIAGAVVTSSAYFTDVKTIGSPNSNVVQLQGIDVDAYEVGASSAIASFDLDQLAPVDSSNTSAYGAMPTKVVDVKNISKSPFKYSVQVVGITLTDKTGNALPASDTSTALAANTAMGVIKVAMERGVTGSTPSTYTPANSKTLLVLAGDGINPASPEMLADSITGARLELQGTNGGTDKNVLGTRFWIDQSLINSWTAAKQNLLQNIKISYQIKITATQI